MSKRKYEQVQVLLPEIGAPVHWGTESVWRDFPYVFLRNL